jgi:hypothetical protein
MDWIRRALLFGLGVYLLIYSLTVDAVQLGVFIVSLLLMGVITWDQISETFGRDGHEHHEDKE